MRLAILLLLLPVCLLAQRPAYTFRRAFGVGVNMYASGLAGGWHEAIHYHYQTGFKRVFPRANDLYWDPQQSWKNKYANGSPENGERFWGSTTIFVAATDAKHKLDGIRRAGMIQGTAIIVIGERRPWWHYVLDFGLSTLANRAGFHTTYSLVFK